MAPDPRYCFDCDRRLATAIQSDDDGRLRLCPACEADRQAYSGAVGELESDARSPRFRGAIALGVPLSGWPTDVALVVLDVWDRFAELHVVEMPGPDPPKHPRTITGSPLGERPPHKWVITTDLPSTHGGGFGGGGTTGAEGMLAWHATIAPSFPDDASRIEVFAQAPGAKARTVVDLTGWPVGVAPATVIRGGPSAAGRADCPSCGLPPIDLITSAPGDTGGFDLDWAMAPPPEPSRDAFPVPDARSLCDGCAAAHRQVLAAKVPTAALPERVVAVAADLGDLFGSRIVAPSLVVWPTWFDMAVTGGATGPWAQVLGSPRRGLRWTASDDRGGHYVGTITGSHSGLGLCTHHLSFAPTLDPDATALTVLFPASLDGSAVQARINLVERGPG
jgi:hypothetical protein